MALSHCKNIQIPTFSHLSEEKFRDDFFKPGKPVIIDGALEFPARSWTLENLKERVGHRIVHVRQNTNCQQYKIGRQYAIRQTTFAEYVSDIEAANSRSRNSYLAVQNIRKALPELEEDIAIPKYVGKVHGGPFLWIANRGHYEYCHFDPDDGLLMILNGIKQVRLFESGLLSNLYPNDLGTKGRTIQSQVDLDDINIEQQPLFVDTPCHHGLLHSGQMLYIPAFWWHQVTTLEVTVSINIFWGDAGENVYLTKIMEYPVWPSFRYWLLNIIEQNCTFPSFSQTLSRLADAIRPFLFKQWHETASSQQLDKLVQTVFEHLEIETPPPFDCKSEKKKQPLLKIRGLLWRN